MGNKEAQVDWDDDGHDNEQLPSQAEEIIALRTELMKARVALNDMRTKLTDACAMRDALADEANELEESQEYNASLILEQDAKLAHYHAEVKRQDTRLVQTRRELKDLQGANRVLVQQLADVTANREFWYKEAQNAESKHDELEIELRHAAEGEAAIVEAAKVLLEQSFIEIGQNIQQATKVGNAKTELRRAIGYKSEATAKLLERLATLDAAEAALADCGIGGIYDTFDGLKNAIQQMSEYIKELTGDPAEIDIAIHQRSLDELAQTLHTERQLRQEAEQERDHWRSIVKHERAWRREAQKETVMEGATYRTNLDEAAVRLARTKRRLARRDIECSAASSAALNLEKQLAEIEQRAEKAEAANDNLRSVASQVPYLKDRCGCAEALAQLVSEEAAKLLERLASHTAAHADSFAAPNSSWALLRRAEIESARNLAAQIREALDDSQT